MTPTDIRFQRWPMAALAYHVLAHLDLGRDAASLYDESLPDRPWSDELRAAYLAAPGRLTIHAAPLSYGAQLVDRLRTGLPASLRDEAGRRLAGCFADAIEAEAPAFLPTFGDDDAHLVELAAAITGPLTRLRAALWERVGTPPLLVVVDCPALGRHGRGARGDDRRMVATDCSREAEWVACQVMHEEIHSLTDPAVLAGRDAGVRDTRMNSSGFRMHTELERAAIEVGQALVEARAPELSAAYARWRALNRIAG